MEYVLDGKFEKDFYPLGDWHKFGNVIREAVAEPGDNYAAFSPGGQLAQSFNFSLPKPERLFFSVELQVPEGKEEEQGRFAQVVIMLQGGTSPPLYFTRQLKEFKEWGVDQFSFSFPQAADHGEVHLVVTKAYTGTAAMRKVSFSDQGTLNQSTDLVGKGVTGRPEFLHDSKK